MTADPTLVLDVSGLCGLPSSQVTIDVQRFQTGCQKKCEKVSTVQFSDFLFTSCYVMPCHVVSHHAVLHRVTSVTL